MNSDELIRKLQDLGLTEYQSKAYVAAVHVGQARPRELVDESGVPQGRIYDVISSLEELGLVEVRSKGRGKEVRAPSPQTVLDDLKRRRIDELTSTFSSVATGLERIHQRTEHEPSEFVTMAKQEETGLRHAKRAIENATNWLTVCVPDEWYNQLEATLEAAADRGVTTRVLLTGTDPAKTAREFPPAFAVRYRQAADTFIFADRSYGIFSSKHPEEDRQPYIITQEPNLVLLFQNYGQHIWYASRVVQTVTSFPRRYLDPWRLVIDLDDELRAGTSFRARVKGRRTSSRESGTWTGTIVDHDIGGPTDVDYLNSPPTWVTLTLETDSKLLTVGGWKATMEDIAASEIKVWCE